MMNLILTALVTLVMSQLVPGIQASSFWVAFLFALILGITNGILGNLIKFVGCLVNILTLGIFNLVVNALMIQLAAYFLDGMQIDGLFPAILLSIILSIFTTTYEGQAGRAQRRAQNQRSQRKYLD